MPYLCGFWRFANAYVDQWGEEDERSYDYKKWYEEERKNDTYADFSEFIYSFVLSIHRKRDVRTEYLRLKEEGDELLDLLEGRKAGYEAQLRKLRNSGSNQKGKIVYYKQIVEEWLKEAEEKTKPEILIKNAINNCSMPQYLWGLSWGFTRDILSVKNLDTDKRYYIYFGELPITEAERMMRLKKVDKAAYLNDFEKMIFSLQVPDNIREIAKNNYYLQSRKRILDTAVNLFCGKEYESFVCLMVPQIEGLLRVFLKLCGDYSNAGGIQCITKKIREKDDFLEFSYFTYDFTDLRNRVAHGEIIEVDRELAYEVLMDTYWVIKEIDSDQRDYKQWFDFVERSTRDFPGTVKETLEYFIGLDGEKYRALLKRYLHADFEKEIGWYHYEGRMAKWNALIQDERFYKAIWDGGPLQTRKTVMCNGKQYSIVNENQEVVKYRDLIEDLKQYGYVPEEWYKGYVDLFTASASQDSKINSEMGI